MKIKKVDFEKINDTLYVSGKSSTVDMGYLGGFLAYDVGCKNIDSWKEWINDPKSESVSSNYSHLEKKGNKINIYWEYDYFEHEEEAESFETTVEQLNYILARWKEVCEKKPKKVIITRDGDKVTVETKN
ncbi:hypothetical protein E3J79_03780 [Candidatus Dependentiae bacterium]|nr:MAG: hypothetical protein E3J79_03780 [Candidatus Dependentiae bacterium]